MKSKLRVWGLRFVKLAVCAGALWYLAGQVTLRDYVRLADSPDQKRLLISEDADLLEVVHDGSSTSHRMPRNALADQTQLKKGQRSIEYGLLTIVRRSDWKWTSWAFAVLGPIPFILAWRLRYLLAMQEIHLSYRDAVLLTFAGNFFNFAMPGTTGGDVYKAYHIAKRTHKRIEGVTIVFLDRIMGLISFLILAAVALMISRQRDIIGEFGKWVGYLVVAFFIGCLLYFSQRVRRWIRYDSLLSRLPFGEQLRRIDETAFNCRRHPRQTVFAILGTVVSHIFGVIAIYLLARGLGIQPRPEDKPGDFALACMLATVVGYLFAAIPISIQGFGLMEAVYLRVLVKGGWATASQMLALTLGSRIIQIIWAFPGILVPWMGLEAPPRNGPDDSPTTEPAR